jgi:hypothetical protein
MQRRPTASQTEQRDMTEAPSTLTKLDELQATLRASGAAHFDLVAWHYIGVLAERARQQKGPAQGLLCDKLAQTIDRLKTRFEATQRAAAHGTATEVKSTRSPLADLLDDMKPPTADANTRKPGDWRTESPRIRQFRKQLGQISVQKKVSQAIAQAPQNAGPINSHMLVLRSLGIMRDVSPDYLNRFMNYVDTLLCLDQAGQAKVKPKMADAAMAKGRVAPQRPS